MANELKNRAEMDPRWQWDLTAIFKDAAAYAAAFENAKQLLEKAAGWQGRVAEDPKQAIRDCYALYEALYKLDVYVFMHRDEDNSDPERQKMYSQVMSFAVNAGSRSAFLEPELLALPEEKLNELEQDGDFEEYSAFLRSLRGKKAHTLPAEQEALIASAGEVLRSSGETFTAFNDVDFPFPTFVNEQGEEEKLTHGSWGPVIRSRNREMRAKVFHDYMKGFEAFGNSIAAMYAGSVKGEWFMARAHKYVSCRQMSLAPNEIPESVYDNLLTEVENALPALAEYLKLRKECLGLDELHLYDLYVPMVSDFDMKMTYSEACELVCEGLAPLGEEYIAKLREGFDGGWIDVYENKAKASGAYSTGCYGVHPYVLLNHTDDLNGAMTLAHELGHAMHTYYSNKTQPFAKADYCLFVAEVASTCNEVLLMRHLMKKYASDKKAAAFICNQLLEEFRTTVFRQTMFAAFEKESHAMLERGDVLTKESLSGMYLDLNKKYYGSVCCVDEEISAEWMRIPHFYRGFYVYQYATGFSAAVAIAERILKEGESAVRDYKRFLSAGCSVPPIEALRYAGVDMEKPDAVRSALRVFADTVEQMKELMK